ncbi:hypothetical protein AA313_de0208603 [Arthrobotrys entomopaga]|nr:hypothetical protein AA313_de0208603 [Arthrobotrys entomopaga]
MPCGPPEAGLLTPSDKRRKGKGILGTRDGSLNNNAQCAQYGISELLLGYWGPKFQGDGTHLWNKLQTHMSECGYCPSCKLMKQNPKQSIFSKIQAAQQNHRPQPQSFKVLWS